MTGRTGGRGRRLSWLVLLLVAVVGLLATGCGADDVADTTGEPGFASPPPAADGDEAGEAEPAAGDAPDAAPEEDAAPVEEGAGPGDEAAVSPDELSVAVRGEGRRVVSGRLVVAVEEVEAAAARVRAEAARLGGFVASEQTLGGETPQAVITLRVPVSEADGALDTIAALGEERERVVEAEDVEARLVDLESRLETQRASIERVRALLAEADDLGDVITLESELARREADLESIEAQRAALADRAALATLTVTLLLPGQEEADGPSPLSGLGDAWEALVGSTTVLLVVVAALLPWVLAALVLGFVVAWLVRRAIRRRRRAPAPTSASPSS